MGNIKKAVELTNVLISLPHTKYLLLFMILIGLLFGIFASLISGKTNIESVFQGALQGLFLLAIPAILASLLIKLMIRRIQFKRILAASLIGQIIYALAYVAYFLLIGISFQYKEAIIFFAASFAFVIWFMIARFVFILKWRAFLFAAIQIILYGFFLISGSMVSISGEPGIIIGKFFIASLIFLGFVYIFFLIINAPMKRSFGLDTLDAVSLFLAHWFYESKDIEEEFERVGEEAETIISAFLFRRKKDDIAFVIPYVHYGPFGSLGGSNFSYLIAEELKKRYKLNAFVFHGTATHDLNPVASDELDKIISSFNIGFKNAKFGKSSVVFSRGFCMECFAESLIFNNSALLNNSAFIGISRAPQTTEDINFGLGLAIMSESEKHIPLVSVVDQHNAETGEITSFEPGNIPGFNYLDAVSDSLSKSLSKKADKKAEKQELQIGISLKYPQIPKLGAAGIKLAIFSTVPRYVLILIDSNGIKPETREKIIIEIKKFGKQKGMDFEVGIYTTDTHAMNAVRGVLNPIENECDIIETIRKAVSEAIDDMQPASFASFKNRFRINVLGAKQSIEIVSTLNAIIAIAKIAAPLVIIGSIISILWIISKI